GHLQDGPPRVPEPGHVQEEPPVYLLQGQFESGAAAEVVIGEQVHVAGPHGQASACRPAAEGPGTVNDGAWASRAASSGDSRRWRACSATISSPIFGSSESVTSMAANFSISGMPSISWRTCAGWVRYAQ